MTGNGECIQLVFEGRDYDREECIQLVFDREWRMYTISVWQGMGNVYNCTGNWECIQLVFDREWRMYTISVWQGMENVYN